MTSHLSLPNVIQLLLCLCTCIHSKANDENDMVRLVSQVSPTSNAVNALMWQDYNGTVLVRIYYMYNYVGTI